MGISNPVKSLAVQSTELHFVISAVNAYTLAEEGGVGLPDTEAKRWAASIVRVSRMDIRTWDNGARVIEADVKVIPSYFLQYFGMDIICRRDCLIHLLTLRLSLCIHVLPSHYCWLYRTILLTFIPQQLFSAKLMKS